MARKMKNMKSAARLIALLSAMAAVANTMAADAPDTLPALNPNEAWSYRVTAQNTGAPAKVSAMQFTLHAETPSGDIALTVEDGDPEHILKNATNHKIYALRPVPRMPCMFDPIGDPRSAETMQLLAGMSCPYPVKAGASWKKNDVFGSQQVVHTSLVIGPEEVTVPAGTFNATKIEETIADATGDESAQHSSAPSRLESRCNKWYSTKAKVVVKEECDLYFGAPSVQHRNIFELAVYELH